MAKYKSELLNYLNDRGYLYQLTDPNNLDIATVGPMNINVNSLKDLEARREHISMIIKAYQNNNGRIIEPINEPPRNKAHWDYLLSEMIWMANDYNREKRARKIVLRKITNGIKAYWKKYQNKDQVLIKKHKELQQKIAKTLSKDIRRFWTNIQRIAKYKYNDKVQQYNKKQLELDR